EQLHRMLREVADLDAAAEGDGPRVGLRLARDQLEQRALAGAVDAHHAPSLAPPDQEVEAAVDGAVAPALVDAGELHDVVTRAWRRRKIEAHHLPPPRRLDLLDLRQLL